MREILFRGKSIDTDEWVFGSFVMDALEQFNGLCGVDGFIRLYDKNKRKTQMYEVDRETVGQYTGMKDKHGKRIFEGDIVRATIERAEGLKSPRTENGAIGYDCIGMIGLILYKDKNGENVWSDFFNELSLSGLIEDYYFEIIGNIYDNRELLDGGAELWNSYSV